MMTTVTTMTMMTTMRMMTTAMMVKRRKMAKGMACYEISYNYCQGEEEDNASDNGKIPWEIAHN